MGVRASTGQFGYLLGAGAGGAALAAEGYAALCLTLSGLFVLGAAPQIAMHLSSKRETEARARPTRSKLQLPRFIRGRGSRLRHLEYGDRGCAAGSCG